MKNKLLILSTSLIAISSSGCSGVHTLGDAIPKKPLLPPVPMHPEQNYNPTLEAEGLDILTAISENYKESFETEGKPIDVSFTFTMSAVENYAKTNFNGYLIRKESTLENEFYLYGIGSGEISEMWYLNSGLSTHAYSRTKESITSPWTTDTNEENWYSSEEEAFEKVGSGDLGYVILLILTAGPGLSNTAENYLEQRVETNLLSETFETTGEEGNLKYTCSYMDDDAKITCITCYDNYRCIYFGTVSEEENKSPNTVEYNFEWTNSISRKPIPFK